MQNDPGVNSKSVLADSSQWHLRKPEKYLTHCNVFSVFREVSLQGGRAVNPLLCSVSSKEINWEVISGQFFPQLLKYFCLCVRIRNAKSPSQCLNSLLPIPALNT